MKTLFLTIEQAKQLGEDLVEYSGLMDSNKRLLFKGFKIEFGDPFATELCEHDSFEMTPIPEFLEIVDG